MSGSAPLIAFLTPTLEPQRESLTRTLGAIDALRRSAPDLELEHIAVDGGSTDASLREVVESPGTTLVVAPGTNISQALTLGWERATARYVAVMSVGDRPLDGLISAARRMAAEKTAIGIFPVYIGGQTLEPRWRGSVLASSWVHAGLLVSTDLLAAVGGYSPRFHYAMDWEWLSRAEQAGVEVRVHVDDPPICDIEPFGLSRRRFFSAQGELLDVVMRDCPNRRSRIRVVARQLPAYAKALMRSGADAR